MDAMLHHIVDPKALILYYHTAHLRIDQKVWDNIATKQTIALKRLVTPCNLADAHLGILVSWLPGSVMV